MLVILRENVDKLGMIGEVVKVADGYARNFLLPRNLVVAADEKNMAAIEHQKRLLEKKRLAQKAISQELASKLDGVSCTITRKVGDNQKLFGSVSAGDIAEALKATGVEVDKRGIILESPIRTIGTHSVKVRLEADVFATIKILVAQEE